MKRAFLGIDTSNYTTSACIMTDDGTVYDKIPLTVRLGEKGVRQSEAVFQHTKNLPMLLERIFAEARASLGENIGISAVGVSEKPRRVEGSYMPCFLAGVSSAVSIASAIGCPNYSFSHQEGHIRAAILGSGMDSSLSHFYSFHLSGGTCELLEVKKDGHRYDTTVVADTADITLGQLIDRAGVMMGLQFPCGPELERLATECGAIPSVKIKGADSINLSGFENKAERMLSEGLSHQDISAYVFGVCIGAIKALLTARRFYDLPILFSGGVCSSHLIKHAITSAYDNCYFAPPQYSADNAIGICALVKDINS